jgi:small-conductance mechanosensitive channel
MKTSVTKLKAELGSLLHLIPGVYRKALENGDVPVKRQLEVAQDLMDRLGLSAVKAVVSKNLNVNQSADDLLEAQKELLEQKELLRGEMADLKNQLEAPDAMPLEEKP